MTSPVYVERLNYKKMPIGMAIELLQEHAERGSMEFATVVLSNKPYKQWKREQGIREESAER